MLVAMNYEIMHTELCKHHYTNKITQPSTIQGRILGSASDV